MKSAAVSLRGIIRNRKIFIPAVIIGLNGVAWLVFGIHRRSAEPIKVGVLHSFTGTMAISERSLVEATLMAIKEINSQGGLLGRVIEPVVANGRSDWPTFAREAERLITKEKVSVIFGCWTSRSRKIVKPIVERYGSLLMAGACLMFKCSKQDLDWRLIERR